MTSGTEGVSEASGAAGICGVEDAGGVCGACGVVCDEGCVVSGGVCAAAAPVRHSDTSVELLRKSRRRMRVDIAIPQSHAA